MRLVEKIKKSRRLIIDDFYSRNDNKNIEYEENNLQVISERNSSGKNVEKNYMNSPSLDNIIEENGESNCIFNIIESNVLTLDNNELVASKEKTINYNSIFAKNLNLPNKKIESSFETENEISQSNINTVKLNNTDNLNPFCYKIENYCNIIEEIKKNQRHLFSFIEDSENASNFRYKNSCDSVSKKIIFKQLILIKFIFYFFNYF